jgi:hypothetical protein
MWGFYTIIGWCPDGTQFAPLGKESMTTIPTALRPPAPTPLPAETVGYPNVWKDQTLASFAYKLQPGKTTTGLAKNYPSLGQTRFRDAGTSFADAVKLANTTAAGALYNQAQAILQAKNGAYWIVGLGDSRNVDVIDGSSFKPGQQFKSVIVDKVHADLQAVVGASSWVNFSDKELPKNFTFATPAA